MNTYNTKYLAVVIILYLFPFSVKGNVQMGLSPYDYGLMEAKNGIERYNVLLATHQAALAQN